MDPEIYQEKPKISIWACACDKDMACSQRFAMTNLEVEGKGLDHHIDIQTISILMFYSKHIDSIDTS